MIKKLLIIFTVLFMSCSYAKGTKNNSSVARVIKKARSLFKSKRYDATINLLQKELRYISSKEKRLAYILIALSHEKLKRWDSAERIYSKLITKTYGRIDRKVMLSYSRKGVENLPNVPSRLASLYYRKSLILEKMYLESSDKAIKEEIIKYTSILDEVDFDKGDYESIMTRIQNSEETKKKRVYLSHTYLSLSYVSFRDKVTIGLSSGEEVTYKAAGEGLCLGGGWRYENEFYELNLNGCFASASMTVGERGSYFQTGVPSRVLFGGTSFLWKPSFRGVTIGINIPIVLRNSEYEEPTGTTIENSFYLRIFIRNWLAF